METTVLHAHSRDSRSRARTAALAAAGFRVVEALTCEDGARLAVAERAEILLLPLALPDVSGVEICRRMRQAGALPPILLFGPDRETAWQIEGFAAGADICVPEGIDDAVLVGQIRAVLRCRVQESASAAEIERCRIEAELHRERAFLRRIIDSVPSSIMVRDREGRCLLANESVARLYGMTVQALEGRDCREIPTMPREVLEQDREVLETGRDSIVEWELIAADGIRHVLMTSRTAFADANHVRDRVLSSSVDLTWRKRAEQTLHDSELRLRRLYESGMIGVCYFDLNGRVIGANDKFLDTIGYTQAELNAGAILWRSLTPPEYRAADERAVEELRATGVDTPYEKEFIRRDGSRVPVLVGAAMFDDARQHGIAFVLDVTARKRAEDALLVVNERLRESDRRKDEFIAILSHELRNPLAPIRYALPILQRETLSPSAGRAVEVIDRQVEHLTRLVDDLLDVSRITRGKIELRRDYVTLGSIVSAAVEAASPSIAGARHTLEMRVPEEPMWLHADAARIAQVITNLLNNSAKYTPRGGRIVLEALRDGEHAVVRVSDNGMGIPDHALPAIFDMFRQVNRPDRSQGGLGIGLALVQRLVEMHGGTVEAQSAGVGHGAQFVVRLPLAGEAKPDEKSRAGGKKPVTSRRLKVLVVDDNGDLVEMLAMLVEAAGHDVRKALDGRSAVSAALAYRPDVVLLDLGLPILGGLDVARELRRHKETADARLVALTGWGQAEDRRQTEEAGFDAHLTKPTDPQRLERMLAQFAAADA